MDIIIIVITTTIVTLIAIAGHGIAILTGKLRWFVATRYMYAIEDLSNWLHNAHPIQSIRAMVARINNRGRKATRGEEIMNDNTRETLAQLTLIVAQLTAKLADEPTSNPQPTPTTTLSGYQPAHPIAPVVADKPPIPTAPLPVKQDVPLRTKQTVARATASVTLGPDGEITHLIRDDLHFSDDVSFRAPIFPCETTGTFVSWVSAKGRMTMAIIVGQTASGAMVVCRVGDTGQRIAAYIYKSPDNIKTRSVANVTTTQHVDESALVSLPVSPVRTSAPVPTADIPVTTAPVPTIAKRPKSSTRISIPNLNASSRQTFSPKDRLVVFVNSSAQLARTSNGEIRWLVATGSKGKAAIESPTSIRAGYTAYSLQATDLVGYLSSGAYS